MKYALIIGNNKYNDPKLAQLKTPAADSQALAKILDDKTIGSFDEVTPLINQTESYVRRAVSAFLTDKKPDDLVLLYFSGHGVLDDRGRLYLALKDTQLNILKATSIPSSFLADEMDSCRSKRQILILDCCHSGAFARGTKGEQKAITETTFEGSGFGRVVLTASDSTQYALEGDQVIKQSELSLFTHFLLEGLKTGEADLNNDGHIALDEWYDYTYARVISETPRQVPHKWSYNQQGDLLIARNPFVKKKVAELPYELVQALESPFVGIRESAVTEVSKYLRSRDPEIAALAVSALRKMKEDDSRRISSLAERHLSEFDRERAPVGKVSTAAIEARPEPTRQTIADAEPASSAAPLTAQPGVENVSLPIDDISPSQGLNPSTLFWLKWLGTTFLGFIVSILLYNYSLYQLEYYFALPSGIGTGLVSTAQWWAVRKRLGIWWIPANVTAGAFIGWLHYYLYNHFSWGYKSFPILLAVWLIGNFLLGFIFLRRGEARARDLSADRVPPLIEAGARENSFVLLLSVSLILYASFTFLLVASNSGFLSIDWLLFSTFGLITAGVGGSVGISFFRKKEIPRNVGFIALAIFLLLNAIFITIIFLFDLDPILFLSVPGTLSLLAGLFFVSQRETWKHIRYILLSGFLLFISLAYFGIDEALGTNIFSIFTAFFALLAGIFFFLRK